MNTSEQVLTTHDRTFLETPRIGFLTVAYGSDVPTPVPVWFETTDSGVQLFSSASAAKTRRVRETARASFVTANHVGEPEHWIGITGRARVEADGGYELAERLAARYWDRTVPAYTRTLETWRSADLVRIVIEAERIRRHTA